MAARREQQREHRPSDREDRWLYCSGARSPPLRWGSMAAVRRCGGDAGGYSNTAQGRGMHALQRDPGGTMAAGDPRSAFHPPPPHLLPGITREAHREARCSRYTRRHSALATKGGSLLSPHCCLTSGSGKSVGILHTLNFKRSKHIHIIFSLGSRAPFLLYIQYLSVMLLNLRREILRL